MFDQYSNSAIAKTLQLFSQIEGGIMIFYVVAANMSLYIMIHSKNLRNNESIFSVAYVSVHVLP